jgi:peptidyl-prolyl cis-trans isomerase C
MLRSRITVFFSLGLLAALSAGISGCKEDIHTLPDEQERDPRTGLTPLEGQEVLVRVGERDITLGQYAESLLRMDRYERLRYQSEERQKLLLDEMIQVELLAQEARRRGLDKDPEVQLRLRQALRDELLADLERSLPGPESFSEREVRDYYEAHRLEFLEPLRHRVQVIKVGSAAVAAQVLKELGGRDAASVSGEIWAKLAHKFSLDRDNMGPVDRAELRGDLGFVSAPGEARGDNDLVPPEVRAVVFQLKKVGDIAADAVASQGLFYVVRLEGISPARDRTLQEAERTIRIELRRQKFLEAEKKLEQELRKKHPVSFSQASPTLAPGQP